MKAKRSAHSQLRPRLASGTFLPEKKLLLSIRRVTGQGIILTSQKAGIFKPVSLPRVESRPFIQHRMTILTELFRLLALNFQSSAYFCLDIKCNGIHLHSDQI